MTAKTNRGRARRLSAYDRRIVVGEASAAFNRWQDRVVVATVLLIAMAALRARLSDLPWHVAAWTAGLAGAGAGIAMGRLIVARLEFHSTDGPLAAEALRPFARRRYTAVWQAICLALVATMLLVARPSLLGVALPAYLAGALASHASGGLTFRSRPAGGQRWGPSLRHWFRRRRTGLVGAAGLLLAIAIAAPALSPQRLELLAGVATTLCALALTRVDAKSVRFMTIAGDRPVRILGRLASVLVSFAAVAVPLSLLGFGPIIAGIVAAVSSAAFLLMALRVLAYQVHEQRLADVLVLIVITILIATAIYAPIALPLVAPAVAWRLHKRATAHVWMLA